MFKRGDLVWGKFRELAWWPAIVLNPEDCGRDHAAKNNFLLFTFGFHDVREVESHRILDFEEHFVEKSVREERNFFRDALEEALIILASYYNIDYSDPALLFEWAYKGFMMILLHPTKPSELPETVKNALQKECSKQN